MDGVIKRAMERPEIASKLEGMFLDQRYLSSAQFAAYWNEMDVQVKALIEQIK